MEVTGSLYAAAERMEVTGNLYTAAQTMEVTGRRLYRVTKQWN